MEWLFSFIPASLSLATMGVAIWCYVRCRRLLAGASARSLLQLNVAVDELTSACESIDGRLRRLSARVGMRELRERRRDGVDEATPDAGGNIGDKLLPRSKLKEVARARGFKLT